MKKGFNLFILGLIMFLGCLVDVKADAIAAPFVNKEIFIHDWDTQNKELSNEMLLLLEAKDSYEYGFVASDITLDYDTETVYSKLIKYSPSGKVVKELSFTNGYIPIIEVEGDYIYTLSIELDESEQGTNVFCVKYDTNLKEVERENLGNDEELLENIFIAILSSRMYGLDILSTDGKGNTYLLMFTGALAFGADYDGVVDVSNNAPVLETYSWYLKMQSLSSDYLVYVSHDSNDKYDVYSGAKDPNNCDVSLSPYYNLEGIEDVDSKACISAESGVITLYQGDKEVWSKTYSDYNSIVNVQLVDDYIVAIGEKDEATEVIVVNISGELVQKIDLSERYIFIDGGEKNFIVSAIIPSDSTSCIEDQVIDGGIINVPNVGYTSDNSLTCYEYRNEVWYIPLTVETRTDGNGTVTAVESSRYGEDVEFTVTPKEGFVLGEVKVTDEFGNVVTFTDYHFTMPNANVLIDVTFLPDNSDTSDFTIILLISIAFVACIVFVINKRKIETLV